MKKEYQEPTLTVRKFVPDEAITAEIDDVIGGMSVGDGWGDW